LGGGRKRENNRIKDTIGGKGGHGAHLHDQWEKEKRGGEKKGGVGYLASRKRRGEKGTHMYILLNGALAKKFRFGRKKKKRKGGGLLVDIPEKGDRTCGPILPLRSPCLMPVQGKKRGGGKKRKGGGIPHKKEEGKRVA